MTIENYTRHTDAELERELREVEHLMNWRPFQGVIRFKYLRFGSNRWRGRLFFTGRGNYIKLKWSRKFNRMSYTKHGHKIDPRTGRECRGVAMAHELAHHNGLGEAMARWAEAEYLRRKRRDNKENEKP